MRTKRQMQWYAQRLAAVYVSESGRVRDDGIRCESFTRYIIRRVASSPASINHIRNHFALATDIAIGEGSHSGY